MQVLFRSKKIKAAEWLFYTNAVSVWVFVSGISVTGPGVWGSTSAIVPRHSSEDRHTYRVNGHLYIYISWNQRVNGLIKLGSSTLSPFHSASYSISKHITRSVLDNSLRNNRNGENMSKRTQTVAWKKKNTEIPVQVTKWNSNILCFYTGTTMQ